MSRLTRSIVSTWKMTWLLAGASMMSTGSSVSARTRMSSRYERARDDQAGVLDRHQDVDGLDRDAVVVGCREGEPLAREAGQHAGQDGSRLVAGRRERDLGERLAEHLLADAGGRSLARGGDDRELVRVDAPQVRLEPAGPDRQRGAVLDLEVHPLARRQAAHDVGEQTRRDRQGALRVDLSRDPRRDADLEVGRGQLEPGILRAQQDVGQHRQ